MNEQIQTKHWYAVYFRGEVDAIFRTIEKARKWVDDNFYYGSSYEIREVREVE